MRDASRLSPAVSPRPAARCRKIPRLQGRAHPPWVGTGGVHTMGARRWLHCSSQASRDVQKLSCKKTRSHRDVAPRERVSSVYHCCEEMECNAASRSWTRTCRTLYGYSDPLRINHRHCLGRSGSRQSHNNHGLVKGPCPVLVPGSRVHVHHCLIQQARQDEALLPCMIHCRLVCTPVSVPKNHGRSIVENQLDGMH